MISCLTFVPINTLLRFCSNIILHLRENSLSFFHFTVVLLKRKVDT